MNRLWVRLSLAFALVVLVAVGAVAVLINRTTGTEFQRYITHSGMEAAGSGVQSLVSYYDHNGSWDGVDQLVDQLLINSSLYVNPSTAPNIMEPGTFLRFGRIPLSQLDTLLADAKGKVVYDSSGQSVGKRLTSAQRSSAVAITQGTDGSVIGYLLVSFPSAQSQSAGLEQQFLGRIQRVLWMGAGLAFGLALVVGVILSRGMTAPLRRLAAAARAVAGGNLGQRVKIEGSAEVTEVGVAFNEMTSALQKAEALRQNLVADVAHELRTPLSVLQGNLRAILDDVYPLDKAEISRLYDETRLLGRLVDDLRELALADAGQLRLNKRPTDVTEVIRGTVENLALAAEAQEVQLAVQVPDRFPRVEADPDRLAQVLRNLLVNALRHTPPGGSVSVQAAAANGTAEIAVADTGEGIAPEDLPHVFERFWRADPSRARGDRMAGGTGLGLSVAQSLVEAQGGHIRAESSPHVRTVFRFTLPLATSSDLVMNNE